MFLAWSSPVSPEADAEFNDWYANTHVPEVRAAIPAITAVRRYTLLGSGEAGPKRYLALYELADGDAASAAQALSAVAKGGGFVMTATMDVATAPPEVQFLEPVD